MEKRYVITDDQNEVVASDMLLRVAINVYSFLCDVYNADTLILKPMPAKVEEPIVEEPEIIDNPEVEVIDENV